MKKNILITGATDGIGLASAKTLVTQGHNLILHGRSVEKLNHVEALLAKLSEDSSIKSYSADLSNIDDVIQLAKAITTNNEKIDVLINNAGVFKADAPITESGLDIRFMVNTLAPYLLTQMLLPLLKPPARVINLSSAAQSPVEISVLTGEKNLVDDFTVYAQSKLALTMWSRGMADLLGKNGPCIIALNPGSMLGSKMVKEGFGVDGKDIQIGADIIIRAALSDEFASASGQYFDNDIGKLTSPHAEALNLEKIQRVISTLDEIIAKVID